VLRFKAKNFPRNKGQQLLFFVFKKTLECIEDESASLVGQNTGKSLRVMNVKS